MSTAVIGFADAGVGYVPRHRAPVHHRGRHRAPLIVSVLAPQGRYAAVVGLTVISAGAVAIGSAAAFPTDTPEPSAIIVAEADPRATSEYSSESGSRSGTLATAAQRGDRQSERVDSPVTEQPSETLWQVPLETFDLTSVFGMRWGLRHEGLDFAAPEGTPVLAACPGTVVESGWHGGFGQLVVIDHGNGVRTYYAHNSALMVNVGDTVEAGEHISNVGNTGNSFGPHTHFEVHVDDQPVDPLIFLAEQGVNAEALAQNML